MKRIVVMTTLVMLASSVAQGQMSNHVIVQDAKAEQESKASRRKAQEDRAREERATQDEAGEPALPVAPDEAVASASPPKKHPLLSPEELAKARLGDGLFEPDSQPKPGENEVIIPPMFGDFSVPLIIDKSKPTVQGPISTARGQYKIAENESPMPQDRLFINYNYYSGFSEVAILDTVHREIIGFEKTLFDERFSIGLRLPFFQVRATLPPTSPGPDHFNDTYDLGIVLKYALIRNRDSGNVLSTGLVITPPTSSLPRLVFPDGTETHSTLLQPFVGYIWNKNKFFVQGFTSLMAPTDSRDVTFLFNDVGIGYQVYHRSGEQFLNSIVPTFEVHVNTQLDRAPDKPEFVSPSVDLTGGVTFVFKRRYSLGFGVATNLNSPQLFKVETITRFNYRF